MTYYGYGKTVIGGKTEGSREDEQWPRLAIGFFACRVMRAPSGGKTKPHINVCLVCPSASFVITNLY